MENARVEILVYRPETEPKTTALEGRFLTTGPPGKSLVLFTLLNWLPTFSKSNQYIGDYGFFKPAYDLLDLYILCMFGLLFFLLSLLMLKSSPSLDR